jgi:signal transduction histidine kinase
MIANTALSPLGYRLCRRMGAFVFVAVIGIEALLLFLVHGFHQSEAIDALKKSAKTTASVLYSNNTDLNDATLVGLGRSLVQQGVVSGGILFDAIGVEIGRFGTFPVPLEAKTDNRWLDVKWTADQLGTPVGLHARIDTGPLRSTLTATFLVIAAMAMLLTLGLVATAMILFKRKFVSRLTNVGDSLLAASHDLTNVQQYTLTDQSSNDELGDLVSASNRLLEQISNSHRDSLYTVRSMADRAAVAILTYDDAGRVHYANQACFRLCDLHSLEEMQASELPKFEFAGDTAPRSLPESTQTGPYSREAILIGRDGKRSSVVVNAAKVPEDSKSKVRFYASITDISDLRSAEQQLRKQNMELEAANRSKSQFVANMSHELRTPLNAIIGFSEMFVNATFGPLGSEHYQEYAEDIHNSGTHLLGIINDILDLSKIEAGEMELHENHLDIAAIVNGAVRIVHERAANADLNLTVQMPDELPQLNADERGLKQMLINLLSNAIKFTPAGGSVTVGADCRNGCVLIGVADSGIGMSKEDAVVAMRPFGMVDDTNTRNYEGTGLGLPLVKSLIELHGGQMRIDSGRQRGTTVTLTFPSERTVQSKPEETTTRSVA